MMRAHLQEAPAPLSAYWPDVPEDLGALVAELIAKQPDTRPPAASLVATRLRAIKARVLAEQSIAHGEEDPNRTDPTPFDNRQVRYSADTQENQSPTVGPAGTVRLPRVTNDGETPVAPSATGEPVDRCAPTSSMAPEATLRSAHGTVDAGEESPPMFSNATVVSIRAPAPRSGDRSRARLFAALGGALTAAVLSAGIWSLRHAPGTPAAATPVGSPATVPPAIVPKGKAGAAPAPASGPASSAVPMLAAPAETTSPSSSAPKTAPSASASSAARYPAAQGSAASARSRATEKPKGDPLSELKHSLPAPPGPLERPGVTF
jgi:hypothetical protein